MPIWPPEVAKMSEPEKFRRQYLKNQATTMATTKLNHATTAAKRE